jgi:tetratricopeptide (TPR) repeat protein
LFLILLAIVVLGIWQIRDAVPSFSFMMGGIPASTGTITPDSPLWPCYGKGDGPVFPGWRTWISSVSNEYIQAWLLTYEGKAAEAKSLLERHYEKTGRAYDLMLLGNLALHLGDKEQAVSWWKEAGQTRSLIEQAKRCQALQQSGLAQDSYDVAAQVIAPTDGQGYAELLNYYSQFGNPEQFNLVLQGLLRSEPNIEESYDMQMLLGKAFGYQNQPQESLKHYQTALAIKPNDERAMYEAGRMAFGLGDYQSASQYLNDCLRIHHTCRMAEYYLGEIALQHQDYQQAYHWFSLVEDPLIQLQSLARVYLLQNNLSEARRLISEAMNYEPDSVKSLTLLASICSAQQDRACETSAYQKILEVDPGNLTAQSRLKSLQPQP